MPSLPLTKHERGVTLNVRLSPNARRDAIDRLEEDAQGLPRLRISVTAIPEKGKANVALAKLLSQKLRLPKSCIRLIAGELNRNKTVLLEGDPDELFDALVAKLRDPGLMG